MSEDVAAWAAEHAMEVSVDGVVHLDLTARAGLQRVPLDAPSSLRELVIHTSSSESTGRIRLGTQDFARIRFQLQGDLVVDGGTIQQAVLAQGLHVPESASVKLGSYVRELVTEDSIPLEIVRPHRNMSFQLDHTPIAADAPDSKARLTGQRLVSRPGEVLRLGHLELTDEVLHVSGGGTVDLDRLVPPDGEGTPIRITIGPSTVLNIRVGGLEPGSRVSLQSGILRLGSARPLRRVTVGGVGALHCPSLTEAVTFEQADQVDVTVPGQGQAAGLAGCVRSLHAHPLSLVQGDPSLGFAASRLDIKDAQVVDISIFDLTIRDLGSMRQAERITPWWPPARRRGLTYVSSRRAGVKLGRNMGLGLTDRSAQVRARAHYWNEFERVLEGTFASGTHHSIVHELAAGTRREAAPLVSPERALLTVSAIFGSGSRVLRPIVVWLAAAAIMSTALAMVGDRELLGWQALARLWDSIVSPVTLIRQQPESDLFLDAVRRAGSWGRVIAFIGRAIGVVSIVFVGFAVRRVSRAA